MLISSEKLFENLLERQIDAVKDSIGRSRTTWLFATLLTFVIATALFNGTASFNDDQLERRAVLAGVVNRDFAKLKSEITRVEGIYKRARESGSEDNLSDEDRFLLTIRSALGSGSGQLGYLKHLLPEDEKDGEKLKALRKATAMELQAHAARRTAFDTVQIPLIGLSVTSSDIGIVGGLGLMLVGYWLLAALRGEAHAFGDFIRKGPSGKYETEHTPYCREESAYAFRAIRHYMIFSVSTKGSPINIITPLGFLIPPLLVLYNHGTTAWVLLRHRMPELGSYWQLHVMIELAVAVLVLVVWARALKYQLATVEALQAWRQLVESYDIRPAMRRLRIG